MSRQVDFVGYGYLEDRGTPAVIVQTEFDMDTIAGELTIGFGVVELEDAPGLAVLAPDESVLAATPNTEQVQEFVRQLLHYGEFRIAVQTERDVESDFIVLEEFSEVFDREENYPDEVAEPWYLMHSLGTLPGDEFDYIEHHQIHNRFRSELESIQSHLEASV